MNDYILLMHSDAARPVSDAAWPVYFARLRGLGAFEGGSSIGDGDVMRKDAAPGALSINLAGFIRIRAATMADARHMVEGNPVYEAGGSVEIRELPRD